MDRDRMKRIETALAAVRERFGRKDELIERLRAEKSDAVSLLSAAEERASRWQALAEMTHWGELESGASIKVGDRARYLLHIYECIKPHTKALTRRPTDPEYWMKVE